MRGKGGLGQNARFKARITPAYAGKRVKISLKFRASEDHPRVCGEKFQRSIRLPVRSGSPPRMRGKVCTYSATEHGYGITPAYAGKSRPDPEPDAGTGDHPRVCGEKSAPMYPVPPVTGSPPRMRGKEKREVDEKQPCGITPAYAGKSADLFEGQTLPRDHPRVCGEKVLDQAVQALLQGSPPRMRGKD